MYWAVGTISQKRNLAISIQIKNTRDSLIQLSHLEEFILKLCLHIHEIHAFQCIHGSMIIINVKNQKQL